VRSFLRFVGFEILRVIRNPRYLIFAVGFPVVFYLLFSSIYGRYRVDGAAYSAYLMVSMAAYGALGASLNANGTRLSMERATGWARQLRVTPLGPAAYIAAKGVMALAVALPAFLLVAITAAVANHVSLSLAMWLRLGVSVWLGTAPFAVLGVLLGYLFDAESSQGGTMIVYLGLSLLGGLWIPVAVMPALLRHLATWTPSYRYADVAWSLLAHRAPPASDLWVLAAYGVAFALLAAWRYRRDETRQYA
jgi:ABC-2 type transport system permease protein